MRWIGYYERGAVRFLDHAIAACLALQAANTSLRRGIAIHLLRLFADIFLAHAKIALELLAHCDVINHRPSQQNERAFPEDFKGDIEEVGRDLAWRSPEPRPRLGHSRRKIP